jgi:hypothetical protein
MDYTKYTFEDDDRFNRKSVAEKAIRLLSSDIGVSPMVIDGAWGTGKTVFCHQLMNLLAINDTHQLIYIDAFKADHTGEPLIAVLSHLINLLPRSEKINFKQKALPVLKQSLKVFGNAAVGHILKSDTDSIAADFEKEISQISSKSIDVLVDSALQSQVDADKNIDTLVRAIESITHKKPIAIFIDELDRCRPDFALAMLEVIKHVFDVDGVQFVLVTNTEHLRASINHTYGSVVDAHRYLDKFIKFSFALSNKTLPEAHCDIAAPVAHYKHLVNANSLPQGLVAEVCLSFFGQMVSVNRISLREVETIVRTLLIHRAVTDDSGFMKENTLNGYLLLALFGAGLFCLKSEVAQNITQSKANSEELASFLDPGEILTWDGSSPWPLPHTLLIASLGPECEHGAKAFTPTSEDTQTHWLEYKRNVFGDGWSHHSERGMLLRNLSWFLETLNLES